MKSRTLPTPRILTIDIAHPPMSPDRAEEALRQGLSKIELSSGLRVMKIIHGYGSGGRGGTLKTIVQNWVYKKRDRFTAVFDANAIDPFSKEYQSFLQQCGLTYSDIGGPNDGVTVIWVQ